MMRLMVLLLVLTGCASQKHIRKTEADGARLRVELAETYVQKRAYVAAIPLLRRSVVETPADPHVRTLYGTVLREQGLYPQAEKELLEATRLAPASAEAHAALGVLYDLMRRPADAEREHRAALALAPQSASIWNNLGFSLYVARKNDEAIVALEKALALDPGLIIAYNNLGFAYGRRGSMSDAERSFRTAGGEGAALVNMAIIYDQRGDAETAAKLRAEARARDPRLELEVKP
jgi:Flp pilus assembly protein TadD